MIKVFNFQKYVNYNDYLKISSILMQMRKNEEIPDTFLFLEHDPSIYTIGKYQDSTGHFLCESDIDIIKTNRGGQVTWHGKGQVMGYPIFSIKQDLFRKSVKKFVELLMNLVVTTLKNELGLDCEYRNNGIWICDKNRKIGFVGLNFSRWITTHGFSLNVNNNLRSFDNIVPCGIIDKSVEITNLQTELNDNFLDCETIKMMFQKNIEFVYDKKVILADDGECVELMEKIIEL